MKDLPPDEAESILIQLKDDIENGDYTKLRLAEIAL